MVVVVVLFGCFQWWSVGVWVGGGVGGGMSGGVGGGEAEVVGG